MWHCSLSLHPDEPALSDERWGEVCDEFVAAMGFAGPDARAQCRWVAVRHGESAGGSDHAHVVVALWLRMGVRRACISTSRELRTLRVSWSSGLVCGAWRPGRGGQGAVGCARVSGWPTRAVTVITALMAARRSGGLARHWSGSFAACATASRNETEFVRALREHDVRVRPRYAEGGRTAVVGYSVRLPGPESGPRRSVWFGGGRLARDLTLPSLRSGWQQSDAEQADAVKQWSTWTSSRPRTREERHAELEDRAVSWHRCVHEIDRLRGQLRSCGQ